MNILDFHSLKINFNQGLKIEYKYEFKAGGSQGEDSHDGEFHPVLRYFMPD